MENKHNSSKNDNKHNIPAWRDAIMDLFAEEYRECLVRKSCETGSLAKIRQVIMKTRMQF